MTFSQEATRRCTPLKQRHKQAKKKLIPRIFDT